VASDWQRLLPVALGYTARMALIKCSECDKEISDKATKCPHCGKEAHHLSAQSILNRPRGCVDALVVLFFLWLIYVFVTQ
jgi:uncharacterized paraquat-inducible protein A